VKRGVIRDQQLVTLSLSKSLFLPILPGMKRVLGVFIAAVALFAANQPATVCAETESIDLKALAKKARPAVMLLVVSDANGK